MLKDSIREDDEVSASVRRKPLPFYGVDMYDMILASSVNSALRKPHSFVSLCVTLKSIKLRHYQTATPS